MAAATILGLTGCLPFSTVDILIEFPRSRMENVLLALETEVRKQTVEENLPALDPQIRTPEMEALIQAREARFPRLAPLLEAGAFGESLGGRLEEHPQGIEGLSAKEQAVARLLAEAENTNREAWIAELARAHQLEGPESLEKIRSVYSVVLRRFARTGWRVQGPNQEWRVKGTF